MVKQRAAKNLRNKCFIVSGGGLHYRGETNIKHDFEEVYIVNKFSTQINALCTLVVSLMRLYHTNLLPEKI